MKRLVLTTFAAASLALGAMAEPQTRALVDPACFAAKDIVGRNVAVSDTHTAYFKLRSGEVYRIRTEQSCLYGRAEIATRSPKVTNGMICGAADIGVFVVGGLSEKAAETFGPSRPSGDCPAAQLTKLTPSEAAALPRTLRNAPP
jgi:hypothetical protein